MDSNVIFMIIFFFLGLIVGILYSTKNRSTIKRLTDIELESAVKFVIYLYGIVLISLGLINLFQVIHPDLEPHTILRADVIQIFSAFGNVFLGAMAVIISQRQHRERLKKEILEEIIGPLNFEIKNIKENLLLDTTKPILRVNRGYFEEWVKISGTYNEIRAAKINSNIPLFYEEVNEYKSNFSKIKNRIEPKLNRAFLTYITEPIGLHIRTDNSPRFFIKYDTDLEVKVIFSTKYVIIGGNPLDYAKKDPLFNEETCWFEFSPIKEERGGMREMAPQKVAFTNVKDTFYEMLKSLEKDIVSERYIQLIRKQRIELIALANDLLTFLKSYIDS